MEYGKHVVYVGDGGVETLAHALASRHEEGGLVADLDINGDTEPYAGVPQRAPNSPDGNGHTWHLHDEPDAQ